MRTTLPMVLGASALCAAGCATKKDQPAAAPAPAPAVAAPSDAGAAAPAVDAAPAKEAAVAPLPKGLTGYAVASGVLWAIVPPAGNAPIDARKVVSLGAVAWCGVDAASRAVWIHGQGGLRALDVETGVVHTVIRHPAAGPFAAVEIDHEDAAPGLASATGLDTDVAVRLTLSAEPTVSAVVTCEGDRAVYCYSEMTGDDPSGWVLTEDAAAAKTLAEMAKLDDAAFAKVLAARAQGYQAPAPLAVPAAPKVEVDPARCKAEPEDCGKVTYLGGRFWSVVTNNDRGDYFSEDSQLFDAKSLEFVNPDGWLRSRRPHDDLADLRASVAPDGRVAFIDGSMIDLSTGKYLWGRGNTLACGWMIAGPSAKPGKPAPSARPTTPAAAP